MTAVQICLVVAMVGFVLALLSALLAVHTAFAGPDWLHTPAALSAIVCWFTTGCSIIAAVFIAAGRM